MYAHTHAYLTSIRKTIIGAVCAVSILYY